ncbi:MAG: hypothetical protein IPL23_30700 [Saprospiraceae bacterium]|nr:hypothetical protein [Saprospiraceae bacterium]
MYLQSQALFDFPIIAEYYPNEENNRDIDPFVNPSVSFTVPINESLYIPDVDGTTHQIKPVLVESDLPSLLIVIIVPLRKR